VALASPANQKRPSAGRRRIACCKQCDSLTKEKMTMPQTTSQPSRQAAKRTPQPATDAAETEDQVYGLVSVLYHALQGAQACEQYIDDAERAGDDELVKFFEECRDRQNQLARRSKQMLVDRVDVEDEDEDDEDEDDEDDEE
jgi:hypothetical protein